MISVLFVCLGNICRSPLAEGIMNQKIEERGLEDVITADSAGTSDHTAGMDPDRRTQRIAEKYDLDVSDITARPITYEDTERFDYILAMDRENYEDIKRSERGEARRYMVRDFDTKKDEAFPEVPDPYFDVQEGFEYTYETLERSIRHFLEHLIERRELEEAR